MTALSYEEEEDPAYMVEDYVQPKLRPAKVGLVLPSRKSAQCHRYDFLVCLLERTYFFSNFFHFLLGLITTPHVLYVHMTYVNSFFIMFLSSHDHMAKRSHHRIMIFYMTSEFYSMDASPPSFSSLSSTPPPLYSPSTLISEGPTWRRTPPG